MMGATQWPDETTDAAATQEALIPIAARMATEDDELEADAKAVWQAARNQCPPAKDLGEALYQMVESVFRLKDLNVPNEPVRREAPRVGRNDPCPCGSGKKFKQCCGKKA